MMTKAVRKMNLVWNQIDPDPRGMFGFILGGSVRMAIRRLPIGKMRVGIFGAFENSNFVSIQIHMPVLKVFVFDNSRHRYAYYLFSRLHLLL